MSDDVERRLVALERQLADYRTREKPPYAASTWTPAIAGSGTAGTFTYDTTNTKAQYTRDGDRVEFNGRVLVTATAVAPTGSVRISGLPIVSGANTDNGNILGGAAITFSGVNLVAGYTQVEGVITGSVAFIQLYEMGDNVARAIMQGGELAAAFDFFFWGMYKID